MLGRGNPAELEVVVRVVVEHQRAQEGVVLVYLAAVEVDMQFQRLLEGTEGGGGRRGYEAVAVAGPEGEEREVDMVAQLVAEHRLEVGIGIGILPLDIQAAEEVAVAVLAKAEAVGEAVTPAALGRGRAAQQGEGEAMAALHRAAVDDVQHRRHAVAIGGVEASGREHQVVHHVGVDDAHALLLAATYQLGTVDLHPVDIDQVLVERTSTHRILRRQLVVGAHIGQCLDERLDTRGRAHGVFDALDVDFGEGRGADSVVGDHDVGQLGGAGPQLHIELAHLALPQCQPEFLRLVASAGDADSDAVGAPDGNLVESPAVGDPAVGPAAADDAHVGILHRMTPRGDIPLEELLCRQRHPKGQQQ